MFSHFATVFSSVFLFFFGLTLLFRLSLPKQFEYYKIQLLSLVLVFATCFRGIFLGLFTNIRREDLNYHCSVYLAERSYKWLGVKHKVIGKEHVYNQPCVYIVNHQSSFDLISIAEFVPKNTAIIAKESLFYVPILGQFIWLAKNITINRRNHQKALESMDDAAMQMKERKVFDIIRKVKNEKNEK